MKKLVLLVLVVVVLIQFIQPEKNLSNDNTKSISAVHDVPAEVQVIMEKACADCHSNLTNYPWYGSIAPVSWFVARHVQEGKEHLNFSEWASYNDYQKEHILNDLQEVLQDREMPLTSYVWMHETAQLTAEEYTLFSEWIKKLKEQ